MLKQLDTRMKSGSHRDGAGHLASAYEADLRSRVQDRARSSGDRAFVSRTWPGDHIDPESDDEDTTDERGGPFVVTFAGVEFAYDTDASNPAGATREPFPLS
jgi:hypothetical protein